MTPNETENKHIYNMIIIHCDGQKKSLNTDRMITAVRVWKQCVKQISMHYFLNPARNVNKTSPLNQAEVS